MAFTITNPGTDNQGDGTSSSTVSAVTASIGDWIVAILACSNAGTSGAAVFSSCSDSAGNTYTTRQNALWSPTSSSGDGVELVICTAPVTSALAGGTVTVTVSTSSLNALALQVYRVQPTAGQTISFVGSGAGTGSGSSSHTTGNVSVTNGDVIFAASAVETVSPVTGDSDTTNGSWSTLLDTVASFAQYSHCSSQYKIVNATGTQNWTITIPAGSRDGITVHIILRQTPAAFSIVAGTGSYHLTGTAATPKRGRKTAAAAGSYVLTGTAASLERGREVLALAGSYTLTGTAATLTLGTGKHIAADSGSYILTGTTASLLHGWKIPAAAGSYTLTGTVATPKHGWKIAAAAGSYSLTGSAITPFKTGANKLLGADPGSYTLSGTAATLRYGFRVTAGVGSYVLTGTLAGLIKTAVPTTIIPSKGYPGDDEEAAERRRKARDRRLRAIKRARERLRAMLEALIEGRPYVEQPDIDEEDIVEAGGDGLANLVQAMSRRELQDLEAQIAEVQTHVMANQIARQELAIAADYVHETLRRKTEEDIVVSLLTMG